MAISLGIELIFVQLATMCMCKCFIIFNNLNTSLLTRGSAVGTLKMLHAQVAVVNAWHSQAKPNTWFIPL